MTAGHRDLDPTTAWASRLPERCSNPAGLEELVQAVELADTVAGEEGLAWLEGRVTGEFDLKALGLARPSPFDAETTETLDALLERARSKITNPRGPLP
ncbi:hypothetical protein PBI_MORRISSEY_54 [Gordonia phage Morrissey]|nr:hypothetical protein PBI_MORRISSEY_54 [Gordonia phage Morrissey]